MPAYEHPIQLTCESCPNPPVVELWGRPNAEGLFLGFFCRRCADAYKEQVRARDELIARGPDAKSIT